MSNDAPPKLLIFTPLSLFLFLITHSSLLVCPWVLSPSSGERPAESGATDGEQRLGCGRRGAQRLSGRHGC